MSGIIDYLDLNNTIISQLNIYNTTTASYDLSASLTTRIPTDNITSKDLDTYPLKQTQTPYLSVRLTGDTEELVEFGASGGARTKYDVDISGQIICSTSQLLQDANDDETWRLIRNVKSVIKETVTLGNYNTGGLKVGIFYSTGCTLKNIIGEDSYYNRIGVVDFTIKAFSI